MIKHASDHAANERTFLAWIRGFKGPLAGSNPWGSPSLEWTIPSPPPPHNFDRFPVEVEDDWTPYRYVNAAESNRD